MQFEEWYSQRVLAQLEDDNLQELEIQPLASRAEGNWSKVAYGHGDLHQQ